MSCKRCKKDRIASVNGETSDLCSVSYRDKETDGYVPYDIGIGGGDYLEFGYCLECGTLVGDFPINDRTVFEALKS